ncbi:hypothetical protein AGMMS50249_6680 [candidate division SR1 bacterium]|nr:hypothetical protein AGMMS50249_6680 [candidate division SR1 bacterium]
MKNLLFTLNFLLDTYTPAQISSEPIIDIIGKQSPDLRSTILVLKKEKKLNKHTVSTLLSQFSSDKSQDKEEALMKSDNLSIKIKKGNLTYERSLNSDLGKL